MHYRASAELLKQMMIQKIWMAVGKKKRKIVTVCFVAPH